eukprot:CAMPEP_0172527078 /NCGR_PEP_ID=MMETSP1067-20121228/1844_1 /TAXON_ID=265564 ORGANISM="Thalassiosira punctigera, Strain Tpunct2005C2" /NCGR_SAMPLE_ID=MMETSP1067 /ASSEMBLY_ACC=CAM_ASM_000444 /LENGTH=97 /DNA_ID=CAMNT_0013310743 /DNA_START=494 /DNA_END=783 /DNA_ORIENTATION=-
MGASISLAITAFSSDYEFLRGTGPFAASPTRPAARRRQDHSATETTTPQDRRQDDHRDHEAAPAKTKTRPIQRRPPPLAQPTHPHRPPPVTQDARGR